MAVDDVKKFYEAMSKDKEMQQKFMDIFQKYQESPMDEAKFRGIMEREGLPLAQHMGYSFTLAEVDDYNEEMRQAYSDGALSEEELMAVAGGGDKFNGFCVLLGFANHTWDCDKVGQRDTWMSGFCVGPGWLVCGKG